MPAQNGSTDEATILHYVKKLENKTWHRSSSNVIYIKLGQLLNHTWKKLKNWQIGPTAVEVSNHCWRWWKWRLFSYRKQQSRHWIQRHQGTIDWHSYVHSS